MILSNNLLFYEGLMVNKKSLFLGVLGLFFISVIFSDNYVLNSSNDYISEINMENQPLEVLLTVKSSGYWNNFSFIHITGSNWSIAAGYDWCSGNGSWSNPYTIENMTIDASSSPTGIGIYISNSKNDYFIIRNVTVYNGGNSGISLENTNNGTVTNNNCSVNGSGISLSFNCENNTILGNNANNNIAGIAVGIYITSNCDNNTISGNTAKNNGMGFYIIGDCDNNTISGNTANNNFLFGINLYWNCDDNTISGNNFSNVGPLDQTRGIYINVKCDNNTISGNNASYNSQYGIYLSDSCYDNTISGNIASFNSGHGIYLYDNCSSNTISGNNATNNAGDGIRLDKQNYPCYNNTISGNNASYNTQKGIYLYDSDDNTISGNNANNNVFSGIMLSYGCYFNNISGNNATNNDGDGIHLFGQSSPCNNNTISGNNAINNTLNGIYITYCSNNTISGNNADNNTQNGIFLDWDCYSNTISGNNASYNTQNGIYLGVQITFNIISGNNISYNTQCGIWITITNNDLNLLYNNIFKNNTVHARDDVGTNFWNNSVIGNYWDNYTGLDENHDRIGDTPHNFIGGTDYLPIWTVSSSNVTIDFPANNTIWATPPLIKIRTYHPFNHSNWYNVSGNPNIVFLLNDTEDNLNISLWNSLPEGQFQISFYFNDTSGFIYENLTYTLYKDTQAPNITLSFPSDGEYFSITPPSYNVQFVDQFLSTRWYSLNNLYNITLTTNGTMDLGNWTALPEGPVTLRFYADDTMGNSNTSTINIFKDTLKPSLNISAPTELQVYMDQAPEFDLTINDASPYDIWYSLNDGRNISCSASGRIDAGEWNALPDGVIRIQFNVQDAAGNLISIEVDVQKTSSNLLLIIIIIVVVAIAMVGVGLLARRSRIRTRERDAKIVTFLDQQKSAITESDISVYKEQHICLVHKGKIDGISYICPSCGSFYCMKCYDALVELENECWSCRSSIDVSKPRKTFEKYKSEPLIDGKGKKGLLKSTKEVKEAPKSIDDGTEKKGLLKSTEIARKADLKRASLMATTAPELKEPIQKAPLESQTEINKLEQYIDHVKKKLEDIDFSLEIGIIREEKYLRKKELLDTKLNSLNLKLDQIKK
jgi:parallel beta-helix repeat protein